MIRFTDYYLVFHSLCYFLWKSMLKRGFKCLYNYDPSFIRFPQVWGKVSTIHTDYVLNVYRILMEYVWINVSSYSDLGGHSIIRLRNCQGVANNQQIWYNNT